MRLYSDSKKKINCVCPDDLHFIKLRLHSNEERFEKIKSYIESLYVCKCRKARTLRRDFDFINRLTKLLGRLKVDKRQSDDLCNHEYVHDNIASVVCDLLRMMCAQLRLPKREDIWPVYFRFKLVT